ncbi:MAG: hypothetical protein BWZ03_00726 [bacterium ADurb.BinA186]|nr:MAG: hypothetical protein BWZ03_00726 [bacterium ADurb.BinA186]
MWYGDIRHEKILLEKDYDGVRFNCAFQIGDPPDESKINKLSRVHFDIGLSDEKFPQHHKTEMPSMLDNFHPISWYVYPLEQIFAEKLETFVKRGAKNSRAKDLYDMVNIYPNCQNKNDLNQTIQRVFRDRDTDLPISLRDFAQNLDQTILRAGWASIIASEPRPAFDENWIKLLGILADLKR